MNAGIGIFPLLIILIIVGIVLFVGYYVIKAVGAYYETVNQASKKKPAKYNKMEFIPPVIGQNEVQLMICPQCKNTYTDLTLVFCLEDGELLRKTNISLPPDPEETVISGRFR